LLAIKKIVIARPDLKAVKESDFERDVIEYSKEISDQIEINGA